MADEKKPLLIANADSFVTLPERMHIEVEPIFVVSTSGDLRFPTLPRSSLIQYFRHCVSREPLDLRSHVRRIFLANEEGNEFELFPALVDLFIALGQKGLSLRKRLLSLSKGNLERDQYELLSDALDSDMSKGKLIHVNGSILCRGIEGGMTLVSSAAGGEIQVKPRDPLTEAREYLEYSQLDEARVVLEYAILQDSQRLELHKELLEIYRSTRDHSNFVKIFDKLDDKNNPMCEQWHELAGYFRSLNV